MTTKLKIVIVFSVVVLILILGFVCLKIYSDNHVLDKTGMIYDANEATVDNSKKTSSNLKVFNFKKYKIISDGNYDGLRDSYRAGEKVKFKVLLATDTSYNCTVNGKSINPDYTKDYLLYSFIMPACDVEISLESRNTMCIEADGES